MHFLLLNQFYVPDPAPTGQLLSDVASALAARGHAVTVVCAETSYADSGSAHATAPQGIRILRTPAARFRRGIAVRLLSYGSYYLGALRLALAVPKPDVVLTLTTPPLLGLIGLLLRVTRGSRHYIWEMDVYPDIAVALGVLAPRSVTARVIASLARLNRRHADGIIALGPCMRDRLIASGTPPDRIHIAENWADGRRISNRPLEPFAPLTILYSGNLGMAHETGTLRRALLAMKHDGRLRFVFAGGGARYAGLRDFCRHNELENVAFLPYQDEDRLPDHLASCHIGLVTQEPSSLGAVVPSKTYALLAAGRPVLFIGPREATPARILRRHHCGWQVDAGDSGWLTKLLDILAGDPMLVARAAGRARQAFDTCGYDRAQGVARVLAILGVPAEAPRFTQEATQSPVRPIP